MNNGTQPRRVLFVDHTAKMGGGEIALLNLVQNLDRSQYQPVVVLFSDGPLRERLERAGVEVHTLPLSGRVLQTRKDSLGAASLLRFGEALATLTHVFRLAGFIGCQRIDIVHTNSLKADVIGGLAARLARKPLIWHIRDRIDEDYLPRPVVRVFRWLCEIVPHRVIANSAATLHTLHLNREEGSEAIYSGIDLNSPMSVVHDGLRDDNSADGSGHTSERRVGLVGRISPWKGQHIFLKAAAVVHRRFPDVRFQIIGGVLFQEQGYEQDLRELCRSLGLEQCVEFTGHREDVPRLIEGLEILVHASTSGEPFGQVVVEGMAAAKPVVATDGGGVPEIVVDAVTGLLVPMGEAEAMARAICHLLENPSLASAMGLRGRERVFENFTISHTVQKVERLYAELLRDAEAPRAARGRDEGTRPGAVRRFMAGALGQCAASVLMVSAATALTIKLRSLFGEHAPVSAPFLAAVAICAVALGRGMGLFATVASAAAMAYLVFPPQHSFEINRSDQPAFWMFVVVSLLLARLISMLKTSRQRESHARRRAEEARSDLNFAARCGAAFAIPTDRRDLLATIAYMAGGVLCDECVIDLVQPGGSVRRVRSSDHNGGLELCAADTDTLLRESDDPAAVVIRTGKPLFRTVGRSDSCSISAPHIPGSNVHMLVVPLVANGQTLGALTLRRTGAAGEYRSRELRLATEFALRAASALAALEHTARECSPSEPAVLPDFTAARP